MDHVLKHHGVQKSNEHHQQQQMKASKPLCTRLLDDFVEQIKNDQRFNISLILSSASGPFHYIVYISAFLFCYLTQYTISFYLLTLIITLSLSLCVSFHLFLTYLFPDRHRVTT